MVDAVLDVFGNTLPSVMLGNVELSCKRQLSWFDFNEQSNEESICIVGGAPSLEDSFPQLKARHQNGAQVWAMNGTYDWLVERGIVPDGHVMLDARPENVRFVQHPRKETQYYIASQCDPCVFDALEGHRVDLVHVNTEGVYEYLESEKSRPVHLLGGFTTAGMLALVLAKLKGYRHIYLFGMDSSYAEDKHHAYKQESNDGENVITATIHEKKYKAAPWMCQQVRDFQDLARKFAQEDVVIEVCGPGLLHAMAKAMTFPTIAGRRNGTR